MSLIPNDESALLDELIAETTGKYPYPPAFLRIMLRRRARAMLSTLYSFAHQWDCSERFTVVVAPRPDDLDC